MGLLLLIAAAGFTAWQVAPERHRWLAEQLYQELHREVHKSVAVFFNHARARVSNTLDALALRGPQLAPPPALNPPSGGAARAQPATGQTSNGAPATPQKPSKTSQATASIVIIIDDLGNHWGRSKRSAALKGDVTLAILPFSPYSKQLAELAQSHNKEVMLHAPMEPIDHHSWDEGLAQSMSRAQVEASLKDMLADVPSARGINNHMGSAFTQNAQAMSWVMKTLAARNLYFVDSRTSAESEAFSIAQKFNVASNKRDVFLDNKRSIKAIEKQLMHALDIAKNTGLAIAIGHPYPETLTVLEQFIERMAQFNIKLVPASTALNQPSGAKPGVSPSPH